MEASWNYERNCRKHLYSPELVAMADFSRGYSFLDKELQKISLPSRKGKKFVDKLVKVHLKNGEEKWILFHIVLVCLAVMLQV